MSNITIDTAIRQKRKEIENLKQVSKQIKAIEEEIEALIALQKHAEKTGTKIMVKGESKQGGVVKKLFSPEAYPIIDDLIISSAKSGPITSNGTFNMLIEKGYGVKKNFVHGRLNMLGKKGRLKSTGYGGYESVEKKVEKKTEKKK